MHAFRYNIGYVYVYTSICMLQSSGFWDCTGEFRTMENCSISGSSIEDIKLAVSLCIKNLISSHNVKNSKRNSIVNKQIIYLVDTTHWSKHGNTWMDYCKSLCAKRIFIQLFSWAKANEKCLLINLSWKHGQQEHRNTKRTNLNIHEEMILFYTVMGIALALALEHTYHLDHPIEGLGILMLHELQNRKFDCNMKLL